MQWGKENIASLFTVCAISHEFSLTSTGCGDSRGKGCMGGGVQESGSETDLPITVSQYLFPRAA